MADARARLTRFYEHHEPSKVIDVPGLVRKVGGSQERLDQLMGMLIEKYGPEPYASDPEGLKKRIRRFYKHYNPKKLATVENLVQRTKGKGKYELRLMSMLVEKYGEEPEPQENEDDDDGGADETPAAASASASAPSKVDDDDKTAEIDPDEKDVFSFRGRLIRFYKKYAADKLGDVDKLAEKTQGKPANEEKLMSMLVAKYGEEPEFEEDGDEDEDEDEDEEDEGDDDQGDDDDDKNDQQEGDEEQDDDVMEMVQQDPDLPEGFRKVVHCPVDGIPPEYCEYFATFEDCVPWLAAHFPDIVLTTKKGKTVGQYFESNGGVITDVKKSSGKRGGAGLPNKQHKGSKPKASTGNQEILLELNQRQKRKFQTMIFGLDTFNIKLKPAAKQFGKRFACGSTVDKLPDGRSAVIIQGDYMYDLPDLILEYFPAVDKSKIFVKDGGKKKPAFA